ncbi:histidine phosphatase superfamily [Crassisporium funariophilum]|nr:histidine phosphatase superfamily [Crassisporium funariophilum]
MATIRPFPNSSSTVLGIVLLVRHGDRQGFYQSATDYTPFNTAITPLGNVQEFQLGQQLRDIYLNPSSPSFISTVNPAVVNAAQVRIRADGGGEGGVIFNSAVSLLQGLFPATENYKTTLANGSTITGPLGGYQAVPIESVEPGNDVSLEGWTSCGPFATATNEFYKSALFEQKAAEHASFLNELPRYLDGRQVSLENMWNIFDYMNVQSIHNETFAKNLPPTFLEQARDLANFHEYGVFTSAQLDGIGNIAGQTILPSILDGIISIADAQNPLKLVYQAVSYKPFISLFNMTGAAQASPQLAGIVNYAAAVAFEVRQSNAGDEPVIRLNFKNGTEDQFNTYNFMDSNIDVPLSAFVKALKPAAFDDLPTWCKVCSNNQDRGCAALALQSTTVTGTNQRIGPIGAGFLGAGVTLAVVLATIGVLSFFGLLAFGGRKAKATRLGSDTDSYEKYDK